jgi:hypothetical protein
MRIAFLCGSQEPGRDGVGDYTFGFAEELVLQGHEVSIIALRDKFIGQPAESHKLPESGIRILRVPAASPWEECLRRAEAELDGFNPEWVSLQFVCYTFHPKGICYDLAGRLMPLLKGRKLHLMFHETWLCREMGWGWKQQLVGAVQRHFIRKFVRKTKPVVMHTSNAAYAALLGRSGISAKERGLFGAIPVTEPDGFDGELKAALGGTGARGEKWLFGFFGAIYAQWEPEPLLTELLAASQAAGKKPVLLSMGRPGAAGFELWEWMTRDYAGRFEFLLLGEQPTARVSGYLSCLDFGLATTPRSIIGKSSTVVSMLEHGLPVIVSRDDCGPADANAHPLLICGTDNLTTRLPENATKGPRGSFRPAIVREWLTDLQRAPISP